MARPAANAEITDTFVVFDLDRTCFDTDAYVREWCRLLVGHGLTHEQSQAEYEAIKARNGASFQLVEHIEDTYGADVVDAIKSEFRQAAADGRMHDMLIPKGVTEVLEYLLNESIPCGILTYGSSVDGQRFKLELFKAMTGMEHIQAVITDTHEKAQMISVEWFEEKSGVFTTPFTYAGSGVVARQIIMLDDKATNLVTSNDSVKGILIDNWHAGAASVSMSDVARSLQGGMTLQDIVIGSVKPSSLED